MKILHIVNSLEVGGLETLVIGMCRVQSAHGHNPYIFCLEKHESILTVLANECKIPVFYSNNRKDSKAYRFLALWSLVKKEKIEIIHSHNAVANIFGSLLGIFARIPVVHTKHGNYVNSSFGKIYLLNKFALMFTDRIIAVSKDTARNIIQGYHINKDKISIIINGIDIEKFKKVNPVTRKPGFSVGAVGRLSPEKDYQTLLEVFGLMMKEIPDVNLTIVGDGVLKASLEDKAKCLNISKNINFLGIRSDVVNILNTFDVFVQPSLTEGISLTILEAMACELSVVATDVGGNPEIIENGVTGFLVPPKNPQAMADKILTLLNDPQLAQKMGAAGRKRVEEFFSLDRMVGDYAAVYEECLG